MAFRRQPTLCAMSISTVLPRAGLAAVTTRRVVKRRMGCVVKSREKGERQVVLASYDHQLGPYVL